MAQSEDTELRDLVIEALEKNGSLAKIRALLRANVFLAFEDECEKKHNACLDNILKLPEGIISLSIIHEFLEFCNLKNTLFVYMSETRQGKEYAYEGQKKLAEKFNCYKRDHAKEPLLVSIVKTLSKNFQRKLFEQNDNGVANKDEQNCTYIVHEDTTSASSQSNSHSDQSSDEKNKLHLCLPLDNSDTDTSTDSARDKTSSEYIPNEHIIMKNESDDDNNSNISEHSKHDDDNKLNDIPKLSEKGPTNNKGGGGTFAPPLQLSDLAGNKSSESTSYLDFNPFNSYTEKLLNTTGLPISQTQHQKEQSENHTFSPPGIQNTPKVDADSPATLSNVTTISSKVILRKSQDEGLRTETDTPEYSYDFSISSPSKKKGKHIEQQVPSPDSAQSLPDDAAKNMTVDSPHQNSQSSQSSVSISDVAELIELSEANSPMFRIKDSTTQKQDHKHPDLQDASQSSNSKFKEEFVSNIIQSDDSGDFSESPVPSLSNLSLDYNND